MIALGPVVPVLGNGPVEAEIRRSIPRPHHHLNPYLPAMPRYRVAQWIQPGHDLHGQPVDIHHSTGQPLDIQRCAGELNTAEGDRDLGNTVAFPGWIDLQCDFRDPGTDRAEGLHHGLTVAACRGASAGVAPVASTRPCRDQPAEVRMLSATSAHTVTAALPVAAVSEGRKGIQLTEAHALVAAGALAFSDDAPIDRPELLRRALEYHQKLGDPRFSEATDPTFQPEGLMHEGPTSTQLGLPGVSEEGNPPHPQGPSTFCAYSGGKLHIPIVTSAAGISAIREAKKEGLDVSCGTSVHHLRWTDKDLDGFNRALRLHHPLRAEADRNALREAAMDGTLDVVVSDHRPRTPEEHDVDFMVVAPGIAGLHAVGPVLFGALMDHGATEADALDAMSRLLSARPRHVLDAGDGVSFFAPNGTLSSSPSKAPNTVYTAETEGVRGAVLGRQAPWGALELEFRLRLSALRNSSGMTAPVARSSQWCHAGPQTFQCCPRASSSRAWRAAGKHHARTHFGLWRARHHLNEVQDELGLTVGDHSQVGVNAGCDVLLEVRC